MTQTKTYCQNCCEYEEIYLEYYKEQSAPFTAVRCMKCKIPIMFFTGIITIKNEVY